MFFISRVLGFFTLAWDGGFVEGLGGFGLVYHADWVAGGRQGWVYHADGVLG